LIIFCSFDVFHEEKEDKEEENELAYQVATNLHVFFYWFERKIQFNACLRFEWQSEMRSWNREGDGLGETLWIEALACINRIFIEGESGKGRKMASAKEQLDKDMPHHFLWSKYFYMF
jgi:hypothetical protein